MRKYVAAAAVAALLLAGCSNGGEDDRAETVDGKAAGSGTGSSPNGIGSTPSAEDDVAPTLTQRQTAQVLPAASDLPSGWSVKRVRPDGDGDDKIRPAKCDALFSGLDDHAKPAGEAEAQYSTGSSVGPMVSVNVESDDEAMAPKLSPLLDALETCPKFTSTSADDGSKTTFSVSPLSFPSLGERSVAVRLAGKSSGFNLVVDIVLVAEGHTGITISAGGLAALSAKQLQTFAKASVDNLHDLTDA
jgi:hypothetical protein